MKQILFVGLGGAVGSIVRYLISVLTMKHYETSFPVATFIVNIAGCFIAGLIFGLFTHETSEAQNLKLLLLTGFCGGFTTFSAFALENVKLINSGSMATAISYILMSVAAGLLAVWLGLVITR